ncbi:MAG: cell division protein FtsX [Acidimicrobiia bacterium]
MLTRIGYFLRETLTSLGRNVFMVMAGVLTIAVTMVLAGGGLLYSARVDNGTQRWKNGARLEVFMTVDASQSQVDSAKQAIANSSDVKESVLISKRDAYADFKRIFNDQPELVNSITPESLPVSFRVTPKKAELTNTLGTRFEQLDGVDQVVTPGKLLDRELRDRNRVSTALLILSGVLIAVSGIIVATTIRLATYARRREIEVMKLVGASNWFVRVPFMSEGIFQGLVGGVLASFALFLLRDPVMNQWFHKSGYDLTIGNTWSAVAVVLIASVGIGLVSSLIGLWRFLDV